MSQYTIRQLRDMRTEIDEVIAGLEAESPAIFTPDPPEPEHPGEMKRFTFDVDAGLHRRIKVRCAADAAARNLVYAGLAELEGSGRSAKIKPINQAIS